jgi:hypothetical protein
LRVVCKYSAKQTEFSIKVAIDLDDVTVEKILSKLKNLIKHPDFSRNKLGGPGIIVQIDENMLNYKCKSH